MKFSLHALRPKMVATYSVPDLIAVSLAAAVVAVWAAIAQGSFSPLALLACEATFLAFYLVGSLVAGWRRLAGDILFDLPLRLVVGYAIVNTALLALAWLSPLDIVTNFCILLAIAGVLFVVTSQPRKQRLADSVGLWVVGISLVGATLWCQDSIHPTSAQGSVVLFKPWVDSFYHAVHIRIFGAAHGASTIEDFRIAGVPARLYHYGMYLTPAFIKQASGIHSFPAFAGILAPMGVFFTGLAAYAFVGSFWGAWPGLTACAALYLLPDGAQQGMQNTFLSYNWLTQISPNATYGLALLAVAWLFLLRGCKGGSGLQLFAGWFVSGMLIAYKLHFFVASALLLLLVPPLFFARRLGLPRRALWALSAAAVYFAALKYLQKVPGVPPIILDGSCIGEILKLMKSFAQPGALQDFLADRIGTDSPVLSNLLYGVPYVLLGVLGLLLPLLVILAIRLRKRSSLPFLLFPFLIVANFTVMFFGLALDFSRSTPDELSHRPFLVMYFFVAAWVGGALGLLLFESRRFARIARPVTISLVVLLMAIPAYLGSGVQRMPSMREFSYMKIPVGLVRTAEYLRDHSNPQDIFQDSQFDFTYTTAALSERRSFASRTMTRMAYRSDEIELRAVQVETLMGLKDAAAIVSTAQQLGFRWFLLKPDSFVGWPPEITSHSVFQSNGFKLYRF